MYSESVLSFSELSWKLLFISPNFLDIEQSLSSEQPGINMRAPSRARGCAGACIPGARPRRGIYVWKETGNSSDLFDTLTAVGDAERETGC